MWRPLSFMFVLSALLGCGGDRALVDNQACHCAPGWSCDASRNVCLAQDGGSGGGGASGSGAGGASGSGAGGASGGTGSVPGSCSVPDGHVVPYKTVAELETLIAGDWLRCSGNAYPAEFGVGLRISLDRTWNALVMGDAGTLEPITTGFDGYGSWTAAEVYADHIQFNLLRLAGGGAGFFVLFTDNGRMRMDFGTAAADYARLGAGAAGSTGRASEASP